MSRREQTINARPRCTNFSVASAHRGPLFPIEPKLASGRCVPALLKQRRETLAKLERLSEPLPSDLPLAMRRRTCDARRDATAALAVRLAHVERELERRNALPAPDAVALGALPAWLGAWPASTSCSRSALPAAGVA